MKRSNKLIACCAIPLLVGGLSGCYYPVYAPAYPAYPAPYGYMPAPPAYPVPAPQPECQDYKRKATIDGKPQQLTGTACRQPDGSWKDTLTDSQVTMPPIPPAAPTMPPPPAGYSPPAR